MTRRARIQGTPRSTKAVTLTRVEIDHLLTMITDARTDGNYYGPRRQYWQRHDRIERKLEAAQE